MAINTIGAPLEQMTACTSGQTAQPWQLGIVADGCGRTHLVALVTDVGAGTRQRVDLLAPVGDTQADDIRAAIVHTLNAEQLATLRGLVERHVTDVQLRRGLVQLITQATSQAAADSQCITDKHGMSATPAREGKQNS